MVSMSESTTRQELLRCFQLVKELGRMEVMGNYNGKATFWPLSAVIIQCMHSEETGELYEARFLNPRGLLCWLVGLV